MTRATRKIVSLPIDCLRALGSSQALDIFFFVFYLFCLLRFSDQARLPFFFFFKPVRYIYSNIDFPGKSQHRQSSTTQCSSDLDSRRESSTALGSQQRVPSFLHPRYPTAEPWRSKTDRKKSNTKTIIRGKKARTRTRKL